MLRDRRWYLTPCGLDCYSCPIRLRTDEELAYWQSQNVDPAKIRCDGCRSDREGDHWAPKCKILHCCVYEKGLVFCAQCPDFPCHPLEEWGREYEHHARAVETLRKMKEAGIEQWLGQYFEKKG